MKKVPKILTIIFLIIFILQLASLVFLMIIPNETQAIDFKPQIEIGEFTKSGMVINENSIGEYIRAIYNYAIGIVGILAAVVLMWGGLNWLTAGGDQGRITEAKAWIGASITGLIIALTSYLILFTINPDLINFKPINVATVKETAKNDSQDEKLKELLSCVIDNKCQDNTSVSICQSIGGTPCANGCTDGKCNAGQVLSLCNGKHFGTCVESSSPFCVVVSKYGTDPLYNCSSTNIPQYCDNTFSCPYDYSCNQTSNKCEKNTACIAEGQKCTGPESNCCAGLTCRPDLVFKYCRP